MDENKPSMVNDPEDDINLAADNIDENDSLAESENVVDVSEDTTSNKMSDTSNDNYASNDDLASKNTLGEDQYQNHLHNNENLEDVNQSESKIKADVVAAVFDEEKKAESNEYSREERIVNKAGQLRNQKPAVMQTKFTIEEPTKLLYEEPSRPSYSTNPPKTTYYEYGNPQHVLHRAQDRDDDYNVATSSPSPNLMDMDTDIVLEVELETTTSDEGGLWNWLLSWFQ